MVMDIARLSFTLGRLGCISVDGAEEFDDAALPRALRLGPQIIHRVAVVVSDGAVLVVAYCDATRHFDFIDAPRGFVDVAARCCGRIVNTAEHTKCKLAVLLLT